MNLAQVQPVLMREQPIMHRPELRLPACGFGGLRGGKGVRVNVLQRKMAKDEPRPPCEPLEQQFHGRRGLLAIRTLEVAVLHERHRRMRVAEGMVRGADRYGERKFLLCAHRDTSYAKRPSDAVIFVTVAHARRAGQRRAQSAGGERRGR